MKQDKRENNNRPKNFSFLTRLGRIYESQGSSILWRTANRFSEKL